MVLEKQTELDRIALGTKRLTNVERGLIQREVARRDGELAELLQRRSGIKRSN